MLIYLYLAIVIRLNRGWLTKQHMRLGATNRNRQFVTFGGIQHNLGTDIRVAPPKPTAFVLCLNKYAPGMLGHVPGNKT
jgi:hypothetical protein